MRYSVSIHLAVILWATAVSQASGEYGDVVIKNYAEQSGYGPVVFSHSLHRTHYRCNVCHEQLEFEMRAGANDITMAKIADGVLCGGCHNGKLAPGPVLCTSCHAGAPSADQ